MRNKLLRKFLIVTGLTIIGFATLNQFFGGSGSFATEHPKAKEHDSLLLEIAKYREWRLVNPTPVLMDPASALACVIDLRVPIIRTGGDTFRFT